MSSFFKMRSFRALCAGVASSLARAAEQHPPMDCTQQGFVVAGSSASLQSIPVPTPKEGEAVVRVLIAGVCNTDLEIMKGATRS